MPKRPASDAPTRDEDAPSRAVPPEELDTSGDDGAEGAGGGYRRRSRPVRVRQRREAAIAARVVRGLRSLWPLWAVLVVAWVVYHVATTSPAFVLNGSRDIAVSGAPMVRRSAVRSIFAADVGRNIYFIPLAAREQALEKLPWVRRAAVLRIWPDHLRVQLQQRKPVAFARRGTHLLLIDAQGALLPLPPRAQYQFPVLTGLKSGPGTRAERQAQVAQFLAVQDALAPARVEAEISEVDVADPANTILALPQRDGETIRLELGNQDYLARYRLYAAHIATWRSEYPNLRSVNLRYPGQAILDSGQSGTARKRTQ